MRQKAPSLADACPILALPLNVLKPLTPVPGRIAFWAFGAGLLVWVVLDHSGMVTLSVNPDLALYMVMVIMFVVIFVVSVIGVKKATTRLAKEKALAFVFAFGIRDLAWAAVYFGAMMVVAGRVEDGPGINILLSQLYAGGTLLYLPIVTYGILKVQLLDIEVSLQSTVRNTVLASAFVAVYYLISEGVNNFTSNQLGDLVGFLACAVLAIFLAPLNRWADHFAEKLVNADTDRPGYLDERRLQISNDEARRVESDLQFDRAALAG